MTRHSITPAAGSASASDTDLVDLAIQWVIRMRFNTPSAETREAFAQWVAASPLHQQAWDDVQTSMGAALDHAPRQLAQDTLRLAQASASTRRRQRRRFLSVLLVGGAGAYLVQAGRHTSLWQDMVSDYATGVGDEQKIALADGSVVVLNTDSAVNVGDAGERRVVSLRRGEIFVNAAASGLDSTDGLFWVDTPFARLQTPGGRFDVRLTDGGTRVRVRAGTVHIRPVAGSPAVTATAEQIYWIDSQSVSPASASPADDWMLGVLSVSDMPLRDLLAELGRYRAGRIDCDPQIANLRVSGIYQLHDTDRALRFLAHTYGLRIRTFTSYWVTLEPGASAGSSAA